MVINVDWFDTLQKKKTKGMRKLSQYLEDNGFSIVEEVGGGKHLKIKVRKLEDKQDVNAQTIVTTVSHRVTEKGDNKSRLKMVLKEIQNLFQGRGRRGQGEIKLSENHNQKTWTDILKDEYDVVAFIKLLVDADLPLQMAKRLNLKLKKMYPGTVNNTKPRRISDDKSVRYFNDKVKRMSVQKRARIASKLAKLYETTDDFSLKPDKGGKGHPRVRTLSEQFENATDSELEMMVKYMLHLIETA